MFSKTKNSIASGLFWAFGERISAQLVTLVVAILLARLLDPEHYALVAVVTIFITIANTFVTSGFGNSLIQKKDADELDFSTTLIFSMGVAIVFYVLLFLLAPLISNFYKRDELTLVLRVMSLRIIIASINSIQHAYVSKQMAFRKFFFSTLFGTVISAFVGIFLAYKGYGVWALVAQYLTNTTVDTIVLSYTCGWKPSFHFSFQRMKRLYSYGWKLLVSDLFGTLYEQLRAFVLSKCFRPTELSFYNQGEKYPAVFINNIEASMHKVLFQTLSDSQDDINRVKEITRSTIRISIFILSPVFWGLAACGDSLVSFLLTDKWLPCVPYMRIVCALYLVHPIFSAHTRVLKAIGKSGKFMLLTIVRYTVGILLLVLSIVFFEEPHIVIFSSAITMFIVTAICGKISRDEIAYAVKEQLQDSCPAIFCGLLMFAFVYYLGACLGNSFLTLVFQFFIGLFLYVTFSFFFNKSVLQNVFLLVKSMLKRKVKGL